LFEEASSIPGNDNPKFSISINTNSGCPKFLSKDPQGLRKISGAFFAITPPKEDAGCWMLDAGPNNQHPASSIFWHGRC
jgi:hypothetical protein